MQLDTKEGQLESGSNLAQIELCIERYYKQDLSDDERVKTALEIKRLLPLLTKDEKHKLQEIIDQHREGLESQQKEIQPLEHAIGWAPTSANLRVIDAARLSLADDEGHIAAHHKNKPKIAEKLRLAKEARDKKLSAPKEDTIVPADDARNIRGESFPGPVRPDINLNDSDGKKAAESVSNGLTTGAERGFKTSGDPGISSLLSNVSEPAESIQADAGTAPPVIETAKSDGKAVEIDPIKVESSAAEDAAPTEANDKTQIKLGRTVGDSGYEAAAGVGLAAGDHSLHAEQDDLSKVAIPVIPDEAEGSGLLGFFKRLIPRGDAGADQFNLAEAVAERRGKKAKPDVTIENKRAA